MPKKILTISIISIIILALIGGGAVWYVKTQKQEFTPSDDLGTVNPAVTENEDRQSAIENQKSEIINTDDWLTYRNEEYGFEVKYPEGWEIKEENNKLSFIDPKNYDDFYKWTEMEIFFWDGNNSIEERILKNYNYQTLNELIEKEIDVVSYSYTNIDNNNVFTLISGAHILNSYYYLPSHLKNRSYIRINMRSGHKLENSILSTIKLY